MNIGTARRKELQKGDGEDLTPRRELDKLRLLNEPMGCPRNITFKINKIIFELDPKILRVKEQTQIIRLKILHEVLMERPYPPVGRSVEVF